MRKVVFPLIFSGLLLGVAVAQNNTTALGVEEMDRGDIKKICLVAVSYALLAEVNESQLERNELYYVPSIKKWKMVITDRQTTPQGEIKQTVVCYVSGDMFNFFVETVIK